MPEDDGFKVVTRDDVSDAGLMEGLFREVNRQVKYTNELIEHRVIPAQKAQTEEISDLRGQVNTLQSLVGTFDGRLVHLDDRVVAVEEVSQDYPRLAERVTALETKTISLNKDVKEIQARPTAPTPVKVRAIYLIFASAVVILASAGIALALH